MRDPVLKTIKLHRQPVSIPLIQQAMAARPEDYPKGAICAHCGRQTAYAFAEMWPVEFVYEMPGRYSYSQYVYACTQAHAAQFILSWWDSDGDTTVDLPMGVA